MPKLKRIIITRNVRFNEAVFYNGKKNKHPMAVERVINLINLFKKPDGDAEFLFILQLIVA